MTFENNFINHSKEYIFLDNETLLNQREKVFKKIIHKNYDKKNNDSLKNISFSDLSSFDYLHEESKSKPFIHIDENCNYKINLINGLCKNYKDDNIEIRNILDIDSKLFLENNEFYHDDIVADFNTVFLNSGFYIDIKENAEVSLELIDKTEKNQTIFQNNFINFKKNCKVKLNNEFNFSDNTINNIFYTIHSDEGAVIQHNIIQNFNNSSKLYLTTNTFCKNNSSFDQNTYNFSEGFVRNFHFAKLNGNFAKASLKGCFFLKNDNKCSNKTIISHNAESCESNQTYKGILNNHSKANYYSNTFVSENAQKTEGYQLSKGILLTDKCSFFSKPELRIFADDVKCSHGSTIGPVDESALYYLRSRGINKNQAMKMIISSFIEEDLENLDNNLYDKISSNLSQFLESLA